MNYTKQDCIDELQRAATECGEPLHVDDWRGRDYRPSDRTLATKFGSWNAAKEAAGLEVTPHGENEDFARAAGRRRVGVEFGTDDRGYERWRVYDLEAKRWVAVHRLVAIAEYGPEAVAGNAVHHRNGIPWDNRPENLEVMDPSEHLRMHGEQRELQHDGTGRIATW